MTEVLSAGDVAKRFGLPPRTIPDLFYLGHLDEDRCPVIGGRRIIPADYLVEIEAVLRERGLVGAKTETSSRA